MKAPLSYVPTLPASVGMTIGIVISLIYNFYLPLLGGIILFIVLYAIKQHYLAFYALWIALGGGLMIVHNIGHDTPPEIEDVAICKGKIIRSTEGNTVWRYIVEITDHNDPAIIGKKCMVSVLSVERPISLGSTVNIRAKFSLNEAKGDLPHQSDYYGHLIDEGIAYHCLIKSNDIWVINKPDKFQQTLNRLRDDIYRNIVMSPIDGNTSSFLVATLLGDDTLLESERKEQFRTVGVAHILALSGLHVGIIAGFLSFILFPLQTARRGRLVKSILSITLIWVYAFIVGFNPSIIRASVMVTVFILAYHLQNGYSGFNSLSLSVIILLCINPRWLLMPGFQLSVCAVASILAFGNIVPQHLRRRPILYYLLNMMIVPIAAMLGTGIVSAYHFNLFPGMFLASNIIVGIIFPWILIGGLILTIFTALGLHLIWLGKIVDTLYTIMQWGIDALATQKWAEVRSLYFSGWLLLPYLFALIMLALALRQHRLYQWILVLIGFVFSGIVYNLTSYQAPSAELYILSHEKETSAILRSEIDAYLLVLDGYQTDLAEKYTYKYRAYLESCDCDKLQPVEIRLKDGPFFMDKNILIAGEKCFALVGDDALSEPINIKVNYALLTNKFKGHIHDVTHILHPDTILLGCGIHPSKRKRLIKECGDSVAYRNLKSEVFSIVWR